MNRSADRKLLTKREAVIIGIILAAGLLVTVLFGTHSQNGTRAVISVDGETIKTLTLSGMTGTYEIDGAKGAVIEIKDNAVCVRSSDCPDKICVKTGWISKKGEKIVCLPKKLIIETE